MCDLSYISPIEQPGLDPVRLEALCAEYGPFAAEDLVCHAMEELARCLCAVHRAASQGARNDLLDHLTRLSEKATYIGLTGMASVAQDVKACVRDVDPVAEAATLARLARSGQRSLSMLWDLQDVSV